ncbi:MAG: hypothetical protein COA88_08095 [Kordia sp.]|nr:MAG: hypothetical protein COA88_08095 [Kordia sp.]
MFSGTLADYNYQILTFLKYNMKKSFFTLLIMLGMCTVLIAQNQIGATGNVGIGTTTPSVKLEIKTGSTQLRLEPGAPTYGYDLNVDVGTGSWARDYSFSTNGVERAHIGALGNGDNLTFLYFDTNNTSATGYENPEMVITKLGNVGIGTTAPLDLLHVGDNSGAGVVLSNRITSLTSKIPAQIGWAESSLGGGLAGDLIIAPRTDVAASTRFYTKDVNGVNERMRISGNGNVGIGTTTPSSKLNVVGVMTIGDGGASHRPFKIWSGGSGSVNHMRIGTDYGHYGDAALEIYQDYTAGTAQEPGRVVINGDLTIGINKGFRAKDANGAERRIVFNNSASGENLYMGHIDAGWGGGLLFNSGQYINFGVNNKDGVLNAMRINTDGNVGIGTSSPSAPLHVKNATDQIQIFQTTDDSWLYTSYLDKNNARRAYMGLSSDLSEFRLNVENGTDKITFPAGNVGIGTTNPSHKLDIKVNSETNFQTYDYGSEVKVVTSGGWARSNRFTNGNESTKTVAFGVHSGNAFISTGFDSSTDQTGYQNQKLTISALGNVGIGTSTPGAKLDVNGESIFRTPASGGVAVHIRMPNETNSMTLRGDSNTGEIRVQNNRDFALKNSNGEIILYGKHDGNVGIGTSTPDAKLAVNGNIHTQEVKVDMIGWSDFVFEKDYSLPTLKEVAQHIQEKGHLKDIPSAKDVEENGIFLGEMDAKLLQKIEELTLYTLEQEEKIQKLQKENQEFKTLTEELLLLKKAVKELQKN